MILTKETNTHTRTHTRANRAASSHRITISGANPQPLTRDEERGDSDEGEAEFAGAQHLGDVRLDVDVLQVLMRVSVIQAKRRV